MQEEKNSGKEEKNFQKKTGQGSFCDSFYAIMSQCAANSAARSVTLKSYHTDGPIGKEPALRSQILLSENCQSPHGSTLGEEGRTYLAYQCERNEKGATKITIEETNEHVQPAPYNSSYLPGFNKREATRTTTLTINSSSSSTKWEPKTGVKILTPSFVLAISENITGERMDEPGLRQMLEQRGEKLDDETLGSTYTTPSL